MKKLICLLTIFLVCTVCVSCASATGYDIEINPSGSLSVGKTVSSTIVVTLDKLSTSDSSSITFGTELDDATWTGKMYRINQDDINNPVLTPIGNDIDDKGTLSKLTGWDLYYPKYGIQIDLTLTGKVPESKAGSSIQVLYITPTSISGLNNYESELQTVYDSKNYDTDIAKLDARVAEIGTRITTYTNYGIDVSQAESYVNTAKSKISSAKSYGKADITNAYANIEGAETQLTNAEKYLAESAMNFIKPNLDQIKADIEILEGKGWNSEAAIISSLYNGMISFYNANKNIDSSLISANDVDQNLIDSFTTLDKANKYVEDALKNPLAGILSYWWVILIVVGAAAVVAGIIFFIKRRGGSWDELG